MRIRPAFAAAALVAFALPTVAQFDEAETYFSLESDRTYGPGETPRIRLWGHGFDRLQFRVYRVNDPARFFSRLDNPHHFGGRPTRAPGELTTLERFHRWKQRSRTWMRNVVRQQFTADSRVTIRETLLEPSRTARQIRNPEPDGYADVPLLNRQQVVSVWEQPVTRGNRWDSHVIPVDLKQKGVYLVEATDGKLQAYTIICITELAMVTKAGAGAVLTRVMDRRSGRPVQGAEIHAWSDKKEIAKGESDRDGFSRLTFALAEGDDGMLLARRGDDYAPQAISFWAMRSGIEGQNLTAYVYTDRPVYRPGHEVHFKAIVRAAGASGYSLPSDADMQLQIEDPEGKSVLRRSLRPSASGSVSGDLTLAGTAALGYYGITLRSGERYAGTGGFHVEEYRKPEYEVRVTPEGKRVTQGETVRAFIEGRYYFGEPVPNAKVTYVVHRSRYGMPYYLDETAEEEPSFEQDEYLANEQILEQSGTLDADGKLRIEFQAEEASHDLRYRIEARVTDAANREISGTGYVLATRGSFFVHVEPESYVYAPGERARIRVEIRDYDGNPVPDTPFEVRLVVPKTERVLNTAGGRTDTTGAGSVEIPVKAGHLVAIASAHTPEGREIDDKTWLWVSGGAAEEYGRQQRVEIVADRKSYRAGETANLLLITGVPNSSVWVTVESRGVLTTETMEAKGSTGRVEVPIRSEYAPNVFVTATLIRDGQMYTGTKSLRVPPVEQTLDVSLQASKPQFKPGERSSFALEAKDHKGKPVAAEFSVGVVDEAIYAIRRDAAQDILNFFYGRSYNAVQTSTSLHYRFSGASGKRRMQLVRLNTPRRAQLKPDKFVDPRVRKAFPDTIFWNADVRTGANGKADIPVTFPDALTTWRATARGVASGTRVGSAVARTIVRKNLIVRLAAPRFFMQGDEVTISAIVQNYLASEKTARVSLEVQGLELLEGGTRDVTVASRGTIQVDYRVRAATPGTAVLLAKALTDEESDALEVTMPVKPYGVQLSESRAGYIPGSSGQADAQLAFPSHANPASRSLEISLSPSVAGTLFGALDYLTSYPYGCTEQTMSSFLPNVIVSRAAQELKLQSSIDQAQLARKIRAGLDRLYDFQHEDGGWGWWKEDDSQAFMTAYVVAGLARARTAGHNVRPDAINRGANWLKSELPKLKEQGADLRAYMAYALAEAGSADKALTDSVWDQRSSLSAYGTALLGITLHRVQDSRAGEIAGALEGQARSSETEVWWEMKTDPLLDIYTDATPEATAWALKFLSETRPNSGLLPKAAIYLVNHRDQGRYWSSTKQTAMVIYGLTDYLKHSRELQPDFSVTVHVNDKPTITKRFTAADALLPAASVRLPAGEIGPGQNRIRVTKSGNGALYWSASADYFSTAERLTQTGGKSLGITREYFKLTPEKQEDKIVHRLDALGPAVQRGDIIAVRLTITGDGWKYLMMEDPIPSGTEFIPRPDLYELEQKPEWWERGYARREYRDDRAALFQTYFPSGRSEHSYLLKVVNPGAFRVPPARVEPMYQPEYYATTDARAVEVR
jgi:uncharacterized protein YfaS (alpha-2-macroglobulin family)